MIKNHEALQSRSPHQSSPLPYSVPTEPLTGVKQTKEFKTPAQVCRPFSFSARRLRNQRKSRKRSWVSAMILEISRSITSKMVIWMLKLKNGALQRERTEKVLERRKRERREDGNKKFKALISTKIHFFFLNMKFEKWNGNFYDFFFLNKNKGRDGIQKQDNSWKEVLIKQKI